jgi:hypothetical protein
MSDCVWQSSLIIINNRNKYDFHWMRAKFHVGHWHRGSRTIVSIRSVHPRQGLPTQVQAQKPGSYVRSK